MLVDTHCHVQFAAFQNDMDEVASRAVKGGVFMITVGTQTATSREAVKAAEKFSGRIFAAVGLHPNHLVQTDFDEDESPKGTPAERFEADEYRRLAASEAVVAIGECGLDYYRLPGDLPAEEIKSLQRETFLAHIKLASELDLPLIVHVRDAYDDVISILHDEIHDGHLKRRGVIHSFTGSSRAAAHFLDLGFYIGVNGIVTFPPKKGTAEPLLEVVKKLPVERLLLETDSPYLAPAPQRGKRNEPVYVRLVAEKVAQIKNIPFETVAAETSKNAAELFKLPL